jgi:aquaporin TIP
MEIVLTFSLLFTVYATIVDPRRTVGGTRPLLVALVVGANIIAGGPFSGACASMNPAHSFVPALTAGVWDNHWVYWVGPLVGGLLTGMVYDGLFMAQAGEHEQLPNGCTSGSCGERSSLFLTRRRL